MKHNKKSTLLTVIILLVTLVCIILFMTGCSSSGLENGDTAVLTQDTYYATTQDKYYELAQYGYKGNDTAMINMMDRGDVGIVEEGEEVTIVYAYTMDGLTEIELPSGERVYIDPDYLEVVE